MSSFNSTSDNLRRRTFVSSSQTPALLQIADQEASEKLKNTIIWGLINSILLIILVYDVLFSCFSTSYVLYVESFLSTIFGLNVLYYLFTFYSLKRSKQKLLKIQNEENVNCKAMGPVEEPSYQNIVTYAPTNSPINFSNSSLLQNSCFSENSTMMWPYSNGTPLQNNSPKYKSSPLLMNNLSDRDLDNEESLVQYLNEYNSLDNSLNLSASSEKPKNLLSAFWDPPARMSKDASPSLQRCQYQLSTPSSSNSNSPKSDDKGSPLNKSLTSLDPWFKTNIDSRVLIQWNENLRIWISKTILCRLINEFDSIDKSFHGQGFTDIKIGAVGLDRLRKMAQGSVLQIMPNLPTIIPFLELHPNQEYIVKRIRELAKGGCMSEYKWNGGSTYNGKEWDISLPTDAAIIMHLLATYLDTQLLPQPNKPDIKPFTGFHFIKAGEKLPELTQNTLALHEVTVNPPHYRVIIGADPHETVKGYNNLFHSVLLFLYYINEREHGMLERVNMGRSGVNMLWIIQAN